LPELAAGFWQILADSTIQLVAELLLILFFVLFASAAQRSRFGESPIRRASGWWPRSF